MVALDDGDRAARPQQPAAARQRLDRLRQVLEHEADEDVVERLRREGQVEDVGLLKLDVRQPGRLALRASPRPATSAEMSIDVNARVGAVARPA